MSHKHGPSLILKLISRKLFSDDVQCNYKFAFSHTLEDKTCFRDGSVGDQTDRTIQYVQGQRGNRKIFCGGFSYICAKISKNRKYWVCAKQRSRNCKARLITDIDETFFSKRNQNHTHPKEKISNVNQPEASFMDM